MALSERKNVVCRGYRVDRWIFSVLFVVIIIAAGTSGVELDSASKATSYKFLLQDDPAQLFTMQQVTQNYLAGYGLLSRGLYSTVKNDKVADILCFGLSSFFFMPFTHEEGHRSILTARNIGSVSQPYFNKNGFAYVKGVHDETLQHFRDNDLPSYIRLHTAGLESDYLLTKRVETIGAFAFDDFRYYRWEYLIRKLTLAQYYLSGLLKAEIDEPEEENELERDIVGYDTYGAARHLFRPAMEFHRYTTYSELTGEERKFIKRSGYRSLLNALHPLVAGRENFAYKDNITWSAGAGYTMAPFGDFIDETFWASYKKKYNVMLYLRQFQNYDAWFPAVGAGLIRYQPIERLSIDCSGHFWRQPENFAFRTSSAFSGGAFDLDLSWFMLYEGDDAVKRGASVDLGFLYKTDGFMPEIMFLEEQFVFRIGTTLRL